MRSDQKIYRDAVERVSRSRPAALSLSGDVHARARRMSAALNRAKRKASKRERSGTVEAKLFEELQKNLLVERIKTFLYKHSAGYVVPVVLSLHGFFAGRYSITFIMIGRGHKHFSTHATQAFP